MANNHPGLLKIFEKSRWPDWTRALGYIDTLGPAHKTWRVKPLHYGLGPKSRAIAIPLTPWLGDDTSSFRSVPFGRSGHVVEFDD